MSDPLYITDVNPADVLVGSGFSQNEHKGNIRYRKMIGQRVDEYLATTSGKNKIAQEIVDAVYAKNGRFLKKVEAAEVAKAGFPEGVSAWVQLDDETWILAKVRKALRQKNGVDKTNTASRRALGSTSKGLGVTLPILDAAEKGRRGEVERLVTQEDADVNEQDEHGYTPLMFAAYHGRFNTARYLLEQGAKHELQGISGCTALYWAGAQGNAQVACLLLKYGASVSIPDEKGLTVADVAIGECKNIDWDSFQQAQKITPDNLLAVVGKDSRKKRRKVSVDSVAVSAASPQPRDSSRAAAQDDTETTDSKKPAAAKQPATSTSTAPLAVSDQLVASAAAAASTITSLTDQNDALRQQVHNLQQQQQASRATLMAENASLREKNSRLKQQLKNNNGSRKQGIKNPRDD